MSALSVHKKQIGDLRDRVELLGRELEREQKLRRAEERYVAKMERLLAEEEGLRKAMEFMLRLIPKEVKERYVGQFNRLDPKLPSSMSRSHPGRR